MKFFKVSGLPLLRRQLLTLTRLLKLLNQLKVARCSNRVRALKDILICKLPECTITAYMSEVVHSLSQVELTAFEDELCFRQVHASLGITMLPF